MIIALKTTKKKISTSLLWYVYNQCTSYFPIVYSSVFLFSLCLFPFKKNIEYSLSFIRTPPFFFSHYLSNKRKSIFCFNLIKMTKLVRKLKQMAKKRAHRKTVQKKKELRHVRATLEAKELERNKLSTEVEKEITRLAQEDADEGGVAPASAQESESDNESESTNARKGQVRKIGDLVLDLPNRKSKKQLTRKQRKRKEKMVDRGVVISETLDKKWDLKKRRVKVRAQIRNQDLHN